MRRDVCQKYVVTGKTGLPNTSTPAPNVSHIDCFRKKQMSKDLAGLPTATLSHNKWIVESKAAAEGTVICSRTKLRIRKSNFARSKLGIQTSISSQLNQ